ncbi:unnamed protein product [Aphanomyces euteiches]
MLRSNQPKYSTFAAATKKVHPRQEASFLSRVFLSWCLPLVREQRQLNIDDVWSLENINTAETNTKALSASFKRSQSVFWSGMDVYGYLYVLSGFVGALKGMLFQKLLSKASYAKSDIPVLANVYSADMDSLLWASVSLNNLWILPTQVVVISYMLYQQIGAAAFAGMGMIVLSLLFGACVSTIQSKAFANVSTSRDQRMQAVKETFGSILVVKLQAWEAKCREKIQKLREIGLHFVLMAII